MNKWKKSEAIAFLKSSVHLKRHLQHKFRAWQLEKGCDFQLPISSWVMLSGCSKEQSYRERTQACERLTWRHPTGEENQGEWRRSWMLTPWDNLHPSHGVLIHLIIVKMQNSAPSCVCSCMLQTMFPFYWLRGGLGPEGTWRCRTN